jgi:hypothetical protein
MRELREPLGGSHANPEDTMQIAKAYTAGTDGIQGFYGVIVFDDGKRETVIDRALVYNGKNVEPYWSEGNFDTREEAKAALRRRLNTLRAKR